MARQYLAAIRHLVRSADPTIPTPGTGDEYFNSTSATKKLYNGSAWLYSNEFIQVFSIQGALAVGVTGRKQRIYNRSGSPWLLVGLNMYLGTASTGADVSAQVNKNGTSFATITVTATTNNANTAPGSVVSDGDYLDVDVTAVGSGVAGADATLTFNFAS